MTKEILFILILIVSNIIQTITGFAGGPLAMPPAIALLGISDAKAAITLIFWFSTLIVTFQNLKYINWKKLGIILFFMAIGVVFGLWIYDYCPVKYLMLLYGIVVVLIGLKKLLIKQTRELPVPVTYLALFAAGAMQAMFTSGGPFLVIYATAAMKDKKEFRATVSSIWTVLNIFLCFQMYRRGMYTPYVNRLVLLTMIPVFGAIFVGNKISKKLNQAAFLKLVYILLMISGGILIVNYFTA